MCIRDSPADIRDGGVVEGRLEVGGVGQRRHLDAGLLSLIHVYKRQVQELAAARAAPGAGQPDAEEFGDRVAVLQKEDVGDSAVLVAVDTGEDTELLPAGLPEVPYGGDLARHEHRALRVQDDSGLHRCLQEFGGHVLDRGGVAAGELAGDQSVPVPGGAQQQAHARTVRAADGCEVGVDVLVVDVVSGGRQSGVQLGQLGDRHDRFAFGGDRGAGVDVLLASDESEDLHVGAAAGARTPPGRQDRGGLGGRVQWCEQLQLADGGTGVSPDRVLEREEQVDVRAGRKCRAFSVTEVGQRAEVLGGELGGELPHPAGEAFLRAEQQVTCPAAGRSGAPGADGGQPVPLALEGVGGQEGLRGGGAVRVVVGPGDRQARGVVGGECGQGGARGVVAAAQAGQPHVVLDGQATPGEGGEGGLRSDLDQGVAAALGHRPDAGHEAHGFADVPHPVVGGADLAETGRPAGGVGDQADGRLVERDALDGGPEGVVDLGHQG